MHKGILSIGNVVVILVYDKVDIRTRNITRDEEGHCKILKKPIH